MNYLHSLACFLTARRLRLCLLTCLLICLCVAGWWRRVSPPASAASAAAAFNTITVNTVADQNGTGADCSLREAIIAANTNAAFGGCPAGASGLDTIVFNLPAFIQPTINVGSTGAGPLPAIAEPVVIDGSSAGRIELNGTSAGVAADGLKLSLFSG
ncbi:MAG: CSLREA domain-containing protein, partial [Acidobacteria bacterium]|nr:CSLREA domain-containing protein [Acidobacteriota bacterium]